MEVISCTKKGGHKVHQDGLINEICASTTLIHLIQNKKSMYINRVNVRCTLCKIFTITLIKLLITFGENASCILKVIYRRSPNMESSLFKETWLTNFVFMVRVLHHYKKSILHFIVLEFP